MQANLCSFHDRLARAESSPGVTSEGSLQVWLSVLKCNDYLHECPLSKILEGMHPDSTLIFGNLDFQKCKTMNLCYFKILYF